MLKGTLHSRIRRGIYEKERKRINHISKLLELKLKPKAKIIEKPVEIIREKIKLSWFQKIINYIKKLATL